jgi:hypothetical protein
LGFTASVSAQYSPNFSVAGKGITLITTASQECNALTNNGVIMNNPANCPTYNMSGMNWTLTGTTSDPFQFLSGVPVNPGSSYAVTIAGNKFQTRRPLGDICVTSPVINIASAGAVSITISVYRSGDGTGTYQSVDDDVEFKYRVNGGTVVTTGSLGGVGLGAGTTSSKTWTGITGNTLEVWACMAANGSTEEYDLTTFTVSGGTVLPIELSGFFAKVNTHNQVVLDWQTATEQSNAYFDIERSADGQSYKSIGQVKSLGNTANGYTYQYVDTEPLEAIAYYRLKQVDNDGTFKYSPTVSVDRNKAKFNARIFSNPVAHELEIGLTKTQNATVSFIITDLLGKVVAQETRLQGNDTLLTMNVNHLKAGIYLLKVAVNGIQETHKFVKI